MLPFSSTADSSHIPAMAKTSYHPKKPAKSPKLNAPNSKASRPDVQPIGPALAELLNPALNRGDAGMGSGTGLQPPPDNSWDRRAGGEAAAAPRARVDAGNRRGRAAARWGFFLPSSRAASRVAGRGSGVGGGAAFNDAAVPADRPPPPTSPSPLAEGGEEKASPNPPNANSRPPTTAPPRPSRPSIPNWRDSSACRPRRTTTRRWRGRRAARWKRSASRPPPMRWKA